MPSPTLNLRCPPALLAAIDARIGKLGKNRSEVAIALLSQALEGDSVGERLTAIEARLTALETSHSPVAQSVPKRETPAPTPAPTEGEYRRADGDRWLTTQQAYAVAQERGYWATKDAFRGWASRNPEDLAKIYRLSPTGYQGHSNTAASFEDLDPQ